MNIQQQQSTYVAVSTAFTPGATPVDIFSITGSATNNIYVQKMGISTIQNAAGVNALFIAKRSTANIAGTSAAPAIVTYGSGNSAATATVLQYTANPTTPGTLVGYAWGGWVNSPIAASAADPVTEIDFVTAYGQPIELLSTAEVLAFNFKGAALPAGLSVIAYVVWTESSKT